MRLRAKTVIACPFGVWQRGDTLELPDAMGESLVAQGHADRLDSPPAPEAAVVEPREEAATLPRPGRHRRGAP